MSLPIVEGCRAVVVGGKKPNRGTIVTVGKFIGKVIMMEGDDRWEVDKPMTTVRGYETYHINASRLNRLPDKQATTTWQAIESELNWNPTREKVESTAGDKQ